jgi:hypothetical protein
MQILLYGFFIKYVDFLFGQPMNKFFYRSLETRRYDSNGILSFLISSRIRSFTRSTLYGHTGKCFLMRARYKFLEKGFLSTMKSILRGSSVSWLSKGFRQGFLDLFRFFERIFPCELVCMPI